MRICQLRTVSSTLFAVRVSSIFFAPGMSRVLSSVYIIGWWSIFAKRLFTYKIDNRGPKVVP